MSRTLTLLILVVLLSPLALAKTPTLPHIKPETSPPAMAQTPPVNQAETADIQSVVVTPTPTPIPAPSPTPAPQTNSPELPDSSHAELMSSAGIAEADQAYAEWIIEKESGWRHDIWNSTGSGAYGYCQALPADKMASAGSDYLTNPVTQLKWCDSYAKERYGSWKQAFIEWSLKSWW